MFVLHETAVTTKELTTVLGPDLQRLLRGFYEEVTTYEDFTMFAKFTKLYTQITCYNYIVTHNTSQYVTLWM